MLILGRLIVPLNINICGLFSINLGSLFTLLSEVVIIAIILIEIVYMIAGFPLTITNYENS